MRSRFLTALATLLALVVPAHDAFAQLKATTYVTGLSSPVAFIQDPADAANQYVVQQGGRIRLVRNGVLQSTDFLNLTSSISSGGERGLLGLAFAPDYGTSGRFYVDFTDPNGDTVVARFKRSSGNPLTADIASRFDLLWSTNERVIRQPFSNHNGGNIVFGPDGYLYIGMGDGGSGNDPNHNAQNPASLLGKMLRIDVSVPDGDAKGFANPADNPFRTSSRPEIWSVGVRNPWRFSFDNPARGGTGALVIADVGQGAWEEIDYEPANHGGLNYGWRNREGAHNNVTSLPPAFLPLVDPIFEYDHSVGQSITGGFVYRGSALGSAFAGRYFFGDFVTGRIWSIALTINQSTGAATASDLREHTSELSSGSVSTFGVDASGELYFVNYSTGRVMRIDTAGPAMTVNKASLTFGAVTAGSAFSSQTGADTVRLTQTGAGAVSWTASSNVPWLVVSPTSGSGSATLTVSTTFAPGLAGSQTGAITLSFTGAGATPAPLQVTLNTLTAASSTAAFGAFDTPTDGSTGLSGSIAVTGWAVDDVEVSGVRIFRDSVLGEPAGTLVFIGDATLVDGARPDVQAAFPTAPHASRLGWGYLLLTNFLPGLGTGTYRLYAVADDADGHSATIGSKTITCANSTATTPFGAIDTPTQGGTVSGVVTNFGWVLAPKPRRADPPGGGTVQVVIDGAITATRPAGWTSRSDLSALFSAAEYPGINTALGAATFDSATLANGVHTISWVVTDNLGTAAGIGSRYFTVANGAGLTLAGQHEAATLRESRVERPGSSITGRRGFDFDAPYRTYEADPDGRITIEADELDRIELRLDPGASGYLLVSGERQPLPAGSGIDPGTGVFTWNPGVGFVGAYDFILGGHHVRIVLHAQGPR